MASGMVLAEASELSSKHYVGTVQLWALRWAMDHSQLSPLSGREKCFSVWMWALPCHPRAGWHPTRCSCNSQLLQQGLLRMWAVPMPGGSQPWLRSQLAVWTSVTEQQLHFSIPKGLWVHKKIFAFFPPSHYVSIPFLKHWGTSLNTSMRKSNSNLPSIWEKLRKRIRNLCTPTLLLEPSALPLLTRGLTGTFCTNSACETCGFLFRDYAGELGPGGISQFPWFQKSRAAGQRRVLGRYTASQRASWKQGSC